MCLVWGKRRGEKIWKLRIKGKFFLKEIEFEILMLLKNKKNFKYL